LSRLFVRDAETLLLVDDHETQVAEVDVLGKQPMSPDHEVDRPSSEPLDDVVLVLRIHEAAEHADGERICRETLSEGLQVLRREDGRGH